MFSTSPTTNVQQKVPCKWKCLSPFFIIIYLFSSGCDRYVENDDECCNRTFLDHILPTLCKMLPIFTVSSGCERYRKRILMPPANKTFLSHPDKSSLPAVKVSIDWEIGGI